MEPADRASWAGVGLGWAAGLGHCLGGLPVKLRL